MKNQPYADEFTRRSQEINEPMRAGLYKVNHAGMNPEDLYQDGLLCLWEKTIANPEILKETNAYLIQAAKWHVQHILEHQEYIRRNYVQFEFELNPKLETEEMEFCTDYDISADLNMSPEVYTLYRDFLEAVQQRLTSDEKTLVNMLYCGYSKKEIATHFGIKNTTFSMRKRKIAEKLAEYSL